MALTAFLDLEEVVECVAKLEKLGNLEKMALEAFLEVRALGKQLQYCKLKCFTCLNSCNFYKQKNK